MLNIGILALQGAFLKHKQMLDTLKVSNQYVKYSDDLNKCDGLIIPGGESTTLSKIINKNNLYDSLYEYGRQKYIFGTCAGLIMLSNIKDNHVKPLNILDLEIQRNAWGSQINSFNKKIQLNNFKKKYFNGIFIRAPKINKINDKKIKVLSSLNKKPILIKYKSILGATFHPELTDDLLIHEYFINMIYEKK